MNLPDKLLRSYELKAKKKTTWHILRGSLLFAQSVPAAYDRSPPIKERHAIRLGPLSIPLAVVRKS